MMTGLLDPIQHHSPVPKETGRADPAVSGSPGTLHVLLLASRREGKLHISGVCG